MVEKISKIAPVKAVEYDVGQPFDAGHGMAEREDYQSFSAILAIAQRRGEPPRKVTISDPYVLDVGRATQSLFYDEAPDISRITSLIG